MKLQLDKITNQLKEIREKRDRAIDKIMDKGIADARKVMKKTPIVSGSFNELMREVGKIE